MMEWFAIVKDVTLGLAVAWLGYRYVLLTFDYEQLQERCDTLERAWLLHARRGELFVPPTSRRPS